jgi:hypothetical protein
MLKTGNTQDFCKLNLHELSIYLIHAKEIAHIPCPSCSYCVDKTDCSFSFGAITFFTFEKGMV